MALKECWECGQPVARTAKTCPHCGIDNPGSRSVAALGGCAKVCLALGLVLTALLVAVMLCGLTGG